VRVFSLEVKISSLTIQHLQGEEDVSLLTLFI